MSPAQSERQRKMMAAERERVKEGKTPRFTKGMSQEQRGHFVKKVKGKGK